MLLLTLSKDRRRTDVTMTELRKPVRSQWLAGLEKTGRSHTRWVSSVACKNNVHWFSQRPPYINKKRPSSKCAREQHADVSTTLFNQH